MVHMHRHCSILRPNLITCTVSTEALFNSQAKSNYLHSKYRGTFNSQAKSNYLHSKYRGTFCCNQVVAILHVL